MQTVLFIVIAFSLVLLNGFFVAAEFSIVKLRATRLETIKAKHGLSGRILALIHYNLDVYLSACQLGITLASLGLGWIGEPAFANLFEAILVDKIVATAFATFLSFILAFFLISFLHIVVGELAPKSLAIRKVEKVALFSALPLYAFYWLMYPVIWLLNNSANIILKLIGVGLAEKEHSYSAKELKLILNASHLHEDLRKDELQILNRVLDFTDLTVGDLVRPLHEMQAVRADQPYHEILSTIGRYHFSRYPVFSDPNQNKIIGVLLVRDLFEYMLQRRNLPPIDKLMRPLITVELRTPAMDLFHQFRAGAGHFAMVINEIGKYVGFITLDDILSVALGNISDEFVRPQRDWFVTKEGSYVMYGYTPLYTLERLFEIEFQEEEESNTIGGLLFSTLGRMPRVGEKINFENFMVEVMKVKGSRIELIKVTPKKINHS